MNTNKFIEAKVQTPKGKVVYDGDMAIDGVPGTAAPIVLSFLDAAGVSDRGAASDGKAGRSGRRGRGELH